MGCQYMSNVRPRWLGPTIWINLLVRYWDCSRWGGGLHLSKVSRVAFGHKGGHIVSVSGNYMQWDNDVVKKGGNAATICPPSHGAHVQLLCIIVCLPWRCVSLMGCCLLLSLIFIYFEYTMFTHGTKDACSRLLASRRANTSVVLSTLKLEWPMLLGVWM